MNPETSILTLLHWPGCLTVRQTAEALGLREHHVPILDKAKLIHALGSPAQNGERLYSSCEIRRIASDSAALSKCIRAIQNHWKQRNSKNSHETKKAA